MCSNQQATEDSQTGFLGAGIAAILTVPLFVMVGLAVIFNWGR